MPKIYVVNNEYLADAKVYFVQEEYLADTKGYIVEHEYQAEMKVYVVNVEYQADMKIFLVSHEHLLYRSSGTGYYSTGETQVIHDIIGMISGFALFISSAILIILFFTENLSSGITGPSALVFLISLVICNLF